MTPPFGNENLNRMLLLNAQIHRFAEDQRGHIERLTKIAIALSAERNLDKVFDLILDEAVAYSNADGATIYIVSEDHRTLDFKVVYNRTMRLRMGGTGDPITWPSIPLYLEDGSPSMKNLCSWVVHRKEACNLEDVYTQTLFDNSGTRKVDAANHYRSQSMIAIPLQDHEGEVRGVMQLVNAIGSNGRVTAFSEEHMSMLTALASLTAIILNNKRLVRDLEAMILQFVRAIAVAIDRKSKYTGGHIERVAELVEQMAGMVQNSVQGAFKEFEFTPDELRELSLAGWMHDLGKITTPSQIMDKATKLETLFDRFELVKTRFLWANAVIEKDLASMDASSPTAQGLRQTLIQMADDLDFLCEANYGGEFMDDELLARVERIRQFTYDSGGTKVFLLTDDEARNLSIRKGTLSNEELAIMRDHVQITREMLANLTFPRKYRNIPFFAAAHHEKLNGKGYPERLIAEQLPLQARIIAIADLFEALTASDRPYRRNDRGCQFKTLSEALKLMGIMVREGDIDPDLFELLLDSGLWRNYADKYLKKEQCDFVDLDGIKAIYRHE